MPLFKCLIFLFIHKDLFIECSIFSNLFISATRSRDEINKSSSSSLLLSSSSLSEYKPLDYKIKEERSIESSDKFSFSKESNEYNHGHVKILNRILNGIINENNYEKFKRNFPKCLVKVIASYVYDELISSLHHQIMNKLKISEERREKLDFYNENFIKELCSLIPFWNNKFNWNDLFWIDLSRLFFKWLIYMREKSVDVGNNFEFMKISKSIESIIPKIIIKSHIAILSDFNLESLSEFGLDRFMELITVELIENYSQIFNLFANVIEKFYDNQGEQRISCDQLENSHFNGNYESNILLKYLIILCDPRGKMRNCILKKDFQSKCLERISINVSITRDYLENLRFNGPKDLEIRRNTGFISKFIVEFFLSRNKRFRIKDWNDLDPLLQKLKEIEIIEKGNSIKNYWI